MNVRAWQERQGLGGRRGGHDRGALNGQGLSEDLPVIVVVLHDEDPDPWGRRAVCR